MTVAAVGVVPASRVALDTSSLLIAFGPLLTFKAPSPKLIISDEFKTTVMIRFSARGAYLLLVPQGRALIRDRALI